MKKDTYYFSLSVIVSMIFHCVLIFSLTFIDLDRVPKPPQYMEIAFVSEIVPQIATEMEPQASTPAQPPPSQKNLKTDSQVKSRPPVVKETIIPVFAPEKEIVKVQPKIEPKVTEQVIKKEPVNVISPPQVITEENSSAGDNLAGAGSPGNNNGEGGNGNALIEGPVAKRKLIKALYPSYPEWAKQKGIESDVELKFWVDPVGNVMTVEVETLSGHFDLDRLAVEAVQKWKFEVLSPNIEKRAQWGTVVIHFRLE
ncbi:MAG: hypothetical protein DKM50_07130 [Candidatus Margulisiibacteriota bacterium]|nr:MAG: hypothetical protein A2X42_01545 [Candidatus Margulisbacteria bacterium GWF2_38_17]OGI10508.1 MAG: hypothetical protein A2X41_07045 [Candidatus Margulisbacteria bacterium GWE2_39_32]PZM79946.1 MAG: hypothetical protein DKM50_07130 [Candidatus Margulisiibacteriota bacterium]HCT84377.1 hypothetical protein [Candidatus Margulisiibacteriota bacterium]HCY37192.1 hypothetical protein [Candidatus Margulisiibacteriota bacterium]